MRFENEKQNMKGTRVRGSSKLLKDDLIHEAIKEHNEIFPDSDDNDDEGGIVFAPKSNTISGLSELFFAIFLSVGGPKSLPCSVSRFGKRELAPRLHMEWFKVKN